MIHDVIQNRTVFENAAIALTIDVLIHRKKTVVTESDAPGIKEWNPPTLKAGKLFIACRPRQILNRVACYSAPNKDLYQNK